jgi:hypothetical protein
MMLWRFRLMIAAYGADPARWPREQRAAAEALLRRSAQAREACAAARRLDALLAAGLEPSLDEGLADRIVARVLVAPQEQGVPLQTMMPRPATGIPLRLWPQLAGLAAAAILGFIVGWTDLLPSGFGPPVVDLSDFVDMSVAPVDAAEDPLS